MRCLSIHITILLLLLYVTGEAQYVATGNVAGSSRAVSAWKVEKDSRLVINGKSNLGGIACDNEQYKKADTITINRTALGDSIAFRGKLILNVVDFSCHNYFFTYNLRKTLKAEQHPQMVVRFVKLDRLPATEAGTVCRANSLVEISLAGVTRIFDVPVEFSHFANGRCLLKGSRMFKLEDFHLKSPVKSSVFIKVRNEFVVHFELSMTRI